MSAEKVDKQAIDYEKEKNVRLKQLKELENNMLLKQKLKHLDEVHQDLTKQWSVKEREFFKECQEKEISDIHIGKLKKEYEELFNNNLEIQKEVKAKEEELQTAMKEFIKSIHEKVLLTKDADEPEPGESTKRKHDLESQMIIMQAEIEAMNNVSAFMNKRKQHLSS